MINLKEAREKRSLSQDELAKISGVKRSTINNIERAQAGKIKQDSIRISTAWKLCQALGVGIMEFVPDEQEA